MSPEDPDRRAMLLRLLRRTFDAYERGAIDIARLADDSESLIDGLRTGEDDRWVAHLRELQSPIEVVHALAAADGRVELDDDEQADVLRAIGELRAALARPASPPRGPEGGPATGGALCREELDRAAEGAWL